MVQSGEHPRLPLPYAYGAAFLKRGHKLSAINTAPVLQPAGHLDPFESVYSPAELSKALRGVDFGMLWGGVGLSGLARQLVSRPYANKVIFNSYVWNLDRSPSLRSRKAVGIARMATRFSKTAVFITREQATAAKAVLGHKKAVVTLTCGIDTSFYSTPSYFADVPEIYRDRVERLLSGPYMILPGDELRFNRDALDLVAETGIPMVRISQYSASHMSELRKEIAARKIEDKFLVFEKVSYPFLRFLFRNAAMYAGLVNSDWQPAGWTTACEALASGTPAVAYEGLASRELSRLGADASFLRAAPAKDIRKFKDLASDFLSAGYKNKISPKIIDFSESRLDLETTGEAFAREIEAVI